MEVYMEVIEAEHRTKTVGEEACVFCFNSIFFMGSCFVLQFWIKMAPDESFSVALK